VIGAFADAEHALRDPARNPVFIILSVPPQHGKSTLTFSWLVRLLGRYPYLNHAYVTYGQKLSEKQSRKALPIARAAGVELDRDTLDFWATPQGGSIAWTSIGGQLTGDPVSGIAVIDDPFKDRKEAESPTARETAWSFYQDVVDTRCHPQASQIVIATRWHVDDLSGRLVKEQPGKWRVINLPAIALDDDGTERALWPEGRPLEWLREKRQQRTEYEWASMYMGSPIPKGGSLFEVATTCRLADIPETGRVSIGVDLAYSAKTAHSDYSTAVVLREAGGKVYVVDARRLRVEAPEFRSVLTDLRDRYNVTPRWHAAGTEKGSADFFKADGLPIQVVPATTDKFQRALPVAARWNAGEVLVPFDAPWSKAFREEVEAFTGVGDRHDDQVDALASAFDGLPKGTGVPLTGGARVFAPPRRQPQRGGRGKWLSR
jgi:predicted phage terminase large subunit-like protein